MTYYHQSKLWVSKLWGKQNKFSQFSKFSHHTTIFVIKQVKYIGVITLEPMK